jgi:hypothetical protein
MSRGEPPALPADLTGGWVRRDSVGMAEGTQIITSLCLLGMVALGLLSVVPVDLRRGWQTLALYYPVIGLGLFALYEAGIQAEQANIRIDLAFVHPLMGFIVLTGICRWLLWIRSRGEAGDVNVSGTGAQLVAAIVSLVVCFGWFCSMWLR